MATDDLLTTSAPDTPEILEALDGWEVELVFDGGADALQPLATAINPFAAAAAAPAPFTATHDDRLVTPLGAAPAPRNLVQMAVFPTVQETPSSCVRLLAASLIGLGSLLFASALLGR